MQKSEVNKHKNKCNRCAEVTLCSMETTDSLLQPSLLSCLLTTGWVTTVARLRRAL